jgi:hypothetical protein
VLSVHMLNIKIVLIELLRADSSEELQ